MVPNGITHQVVTDDTEGVGAILDWLHLGHRFISLKLLWIQNTSGSGLRAGSLLSKLPFSMYLWDVEGISFNSRSAWFCASCIHCVRPLCAEVLCPKNDQRDTTHP